MVRELHRYAFQVHKPRALRAVQSMLNLKRPVTLKDRRGFSLVELIVVIVVFGILAGMAVPQFIAFRPQNRLNGAARQIYSELMWARSKAVNENSAYVVTFPTTQTMQIAVSGSTIKTVDIQAEYSDVTLASSASTITFSSRGTTDVTPTITLTNSGGTKTVTVRITGTASIS